MDHGRSLAPPRFDAYAPAEIANRVESAGLAKVRQKPLTTFTLAVRCGRLRQLWSRLIYDRGHRECVASALVIDLVAVETFSTS